MLHLSLIILLFNIVSANDTNRRIFFPGQPTTSSVNLFNELRVDEIRNRFIGSSANTCVLSSGQPGICSELFSCEELQPYYPRNGRITRIAFRVLRSRICRIEGNRRLLFCCADSRPIITDSPVRPTNNNNNRNNNEIRALIPTTDECGFSTGRRIVDGEEIGPHSQPWLVTLGSLNGGNFQHLCGGTLITRIHILTASHCYVTPPGINPITHARLGEHSLSKENEFDVITLRIVDRKSPGYNRHSQENDIELLRLERAVEFGSSIRPACLPFPFQSTSFDGQSLFVVGWGDTFTRSREGSDVPMGADVPVVTKSACLHAYRRHTSVVIDDRQLCAGVGGKDACQGDSGGPLIYVDNESNKQYIMGVVSFGVECGRSDFPGIYTFIPQFLQWIQDNL